MSAPRVTITIANADGVVMERLTVEPMEYEVTNFDETRLAAKVREHIEDRFEVVTYAL